MKKNRVKKLEATLSRDTTSKEDLERIKVIEQILALNPKSAAEQIEILNSLECTKKNKELILFAIRAEEEHGNDPKFNKMVVEYGNS